MVMQAAHEIGYPVIVRAAFSLGGLGSGFAHDDAQVGHDGCLQTRLGCLETGLALHPLCLA